MTERPSTRKIRAWVVWDEEPAGWCGVCQRDSRIKTTWHVLWANGVSEGGREHCELCGATTKRASDE